MTEIANLEVVVGSDTLGLTRGLDSANREISNFGSKSGPSFDRLGANISRVGLELTALTAPIALFGITGIKVAAQFESTMTEISARTGIVGDDLDAVSDFALQMGADTVFSAQEAADAFLQLLTSGQTAEQAIATLPFVLDAAAASGEDLGATADNITDILAQFGLGVQDAEMVIDALAKAAGASSADMGSLALGFQNVGPVAHSFGLDVKKTAATLAVLSENGIKGAEAGTALKSMLLNMTRTTENTTGAWNELGTSFYDTEGNARPLEEVIADLDFALDKLPMEEQNRLMHDLAGSYGIVALNALRGELSISDMEGAMDASAGAAEVARARMGTFAGAADSLQGSIEALQTKALTPFLENTLKPMVQNITDVVNGITDWVEKNPEAASKIIVIGAAAALAGPAITGLGLAIRTLSGAAPILLLLGIVVGTFDFEKMGTGFTKIGEGLGAIGAGDPGALQKVADGLAALGEGTIGSTADKVIELLDKLGVTDLTSAGEGLQFWTDMLAGLVEAWGVGFGLIGKHADNIIQKFEEFASEFRLAILNWLLGLKETYPNLAPVIDIFAPNLETEIVKEEFFQSVRAVGDEMVAVLQRQIAQGKIDLGAAIDFADPYFFNVNLATLLNNPDVIRELSVAERQVLEKAIGLAIQNVSPDAMGLIQLAQYYGFDTTGMQEKLNKKLSEFLAGGVGGKDSAQEDYVIQMGFMLGMDTPELRALIQAKLEEAANAGVAGEDRFNAFLAIASTLDMDTAALESQMAAAIATAAMEHVFDATATLNLKIKVQPSFDTSAVPLSVGVPGFPSATPGAYQTGGDVMQTGFGFLHAGELVLTREEARDYWRGGGGVQNIYLTTYGMNPYEQLQIIRRAARAASPG